MISQAGQYTDFPNASDVALPGETIEADPYGALALIESTGQTVAPPLSQLMAAESSAGVAAPSAAPSLPGGALTNTFTLGVFQIPYWLVGAGLVGWYLLSRRPK
jgi:hypothetical protein